MSERGKEFRGGGAAEKGGRRVGMPRISAGCQAKSRIDALRERAGTGIAEKAKTGAGSNMEQYLAERAEEGTRQYSERCQSNPPIYPAAGGAINAVQCQACKGRGTGFVSVGLIAGNTERPANNTSSVFISNCSINTAPSILRRIGRMWGRTK
ncbi:hypothetical protein R3P38DRAFT_2814968 [Favolaschia claudopus]|uniref:Uncharacterized protein n=1 Tax=Favolaschia claudopus TaxID=2862362 RepID=A0AAV9Z2L3_9AGAR